MTFLIFFLIYQRPDHACVGSTSTGTCRINFLVSADLIVNIFLDPPVGWGPLSRRHWTLPWGPSSCHHRWIIQFPSLILILLLG